MCWSPLKLAFDLQIEGLPSQSRRKARCTSQSWLEWLPSCPVQFYTSKSTGWSWFPSLNRQFFDQFWGYTGIPDGYGGYGMLSDMISPWKCHARYDNQSYHHACHAGNYHILWVFNGLTQGPCTQCSKTDWRLLPICDSSQIIPQLSSVYI